MQIRDGILWYSGAADGPCRMPIYYSYCLKSGLGFFLDYRIHKKTVATWRWDAATLCGCFVKWWRSPASLEIPSCTLKSLKQLCSIRSCSCIGYWGATVKSILHMSLCMNQWIHVGCLHIHDSQKKLHRTACDYPRNEIFWRLRSGRLQAWYPHSRFVWSTCSVVRPKARTFAVETSVKSFSCRWVKQHEFARPSFGGEQVTPNMSKYKLKLTFHNWSRTQRYTDGRNLWSSASRFTSGSMEDGSKGSTGCRTGCGTWLQFRLIFVSRSLQTPGTSSRPSVSCQRTRFRRPKNILVVKERLVHLWVAFCDFRVRAWKVKAHLSISTSVNFMQLLTKGCSSSECANRAMYKCSSLQNDFCLLCSPAVPQTDSSSTIAICRSVAFFQVASSHVFLFPKPVGDYWE